MKDIYKVALITLTFVFAIITTVHADELEHEHEHFDIAPYFVDNNLVTGGLDHEGHHHAPSITVYGYEFGEEPLDPFNPSDPGVNQAAGVGNLPTGAALSYNIVSSLLYWDGTGEVEYTSSGDAYIDLLMGAQSRTITSDSGAQPGSLIQSVASNGSVHKHFTTSLYAQPGAGNVPGFAGYIEPTAGIYAFSIELVLNHASTTYTSAPLWLVFNHGLNEHEHHEAMEALIPEPTGIMLLLAGAMAVSRRFA